MPLDNIKNVGKSIARSFVSGQLRRVAGNIAGLIDPSRNRDGSDFGNINRGKRTTNLLSFPLDIQNTDAGTRGNHGHYIMFYINQQTNTTLKFDELEAFLNPVCAKAIKDEEKARKFKEGIEASKKDGGYLHFFFKEDGSNTVQAQKIIRERVATGKDHNKGSTDDKQNFSQTISIDRPATRRLDTVITMFMPADVKVSYKSNYTDTSIGSLTAAGSQLIGEATRGDVSKDTVMKNMEEVFKAASVDGLVNLLSAIPSLGGAREALEMSMGQIVADRMELAFKGIDKRKFAYTFKMMPKSKEEADEVRNIVNKFKFHMLPEMVDQNTRGRLMKYPDTFNIEYMWQGKENSYINKVSECYLESMDVDYGGDRYRTYEGNDEGAPPVETTITLNFAEIELITREKVIEGF